jgi:hypothetical protein
MVEMIVFKLEIMLVVLKADKGWEVGCIVGRFRRFCSWLLA